MRAQPGRTGEAALGDPRARQSRVGRVDPGVDQAQTRARGRRAGQGAPAGPACSFAGAGGGVDVVEGDLGFGIQIAQPGHGPLQRLPTRRREHHDGQVQRLQPFLADKGEAGSYRLRPGGVRQIDRDDFAGHRRPAVGIGLQRAARASDQSGGARRRLQGAIDGPPSQAIDLVDQRQPVREARGQAGDAGRL
ncbi:hypothetical protein D3C80_1508310 [compost metagenome]